VLCLKIAARRAVPRSGRKKDSGAAVDVPPSAVAARTDRRIAFGSRSARRPAPSQAARQIRRDRRAAADGVRLPSPFQDIPARRAVPWHSSKELAVCGEDMGLDQIR